MKYFLTLTIAAIAACVTTGAVTPGRTCLDKGWRTIAGNKAGYTDREFNDSRWARIDLPHDWSIQFNPDSTASTGNDGGYLPGVEAVYRYTLPMDTILPGIYQLLVEGAYMNPTVWVNGEEIDSHTYGYTSFRVDVTDFLEKGDNTIAITVDNSIQKNSRWYSGTGLYRPVWLEHYNPVYIEPGSMFVSTPGIRPGMAIGRMEAMILDTRSEMGSAPRTLTATLNITDPQGVALQPEVMTVTLGINEFAKPLLFDFPIPDPQLWTPDTPRLYRAVLTVSDGNETESIETTDFGLRTFDCDAQEGAFLNDEPIRLNGACVHHDNGILGAAAYDAAEWHKALLLKRAGFNAVRTSHNPPSTAFLDACDHIGLLVIDEAFDGWSSKKNPHDYGEVFDEQWPSDLEAMVRRDRNHPSVIAWSIGNEILERKSPDAVETAGEMAALCRRLDPTRPVTQALAAWDEDWEIYDPLAAQHDIVGYNYMLHKAEDDHERVPDRVIWQTESYPRDAFTNYLKVRDLPYVIGDFVWTGIDYIGESGIGRHYYEGDVPGEHYERPLWPWHNGVCGDIDIIGCRKPISYYRDMLHNNPDTIYMAVREPDGYRGRIKETRWGTYPAAESWNWPGHEGKPIEVEVITRYPQVQLYLDDKPLEKKKVGESTEYKAIFTLPYRPGTLKAAALDTRGKEIMTCTLSTAGTPESVSLDFERIGTDNTDYDLIFVTASTVDSQGRINPTDETLLTFNVSDGAVILGTGNADPTDPVGYTRPIRQVYRGRAAAVIKAPRHLSPTLTVTSASLPAATKILKVSSTITNH